MKLKIKKVEGHNDLYCCYAGQTNSQGCHLELDCRTGELSAGFNPEIGNGMPFDVWHGHRRRYSIPCLTAKAANDLMDEVASFAALVLDGYSSEWDGSNHVAHFTDAAFSADEVIEEKCNDLLYGGCDESLLVQSCDASDWVQCGPGDLKITPATTDEELTAIAKQIREEAGDVIVEGLDKLLSNYRDQVRKSAEGY